MADVLKGHILELTAEIVSAYVGRNSLPVAELPGFIEKIHAALGQIGTDAERGKEIPAELVPAVSIKKSITDDYIISLENGQKFKSLKRHLMATYGMTPDQYRAKWGLPPNYPMVAPNYAKTRSALALALGLGRKAAVPEPAPVETAPLPKIAAKKKAPEPAIAEPTMASVQKRGRGRPAKAA